MAGRLAANDPPHPGPCAQARAVAEPPTTALVSPRLVNSWRIRALPDPVTVKLDVALEWISARSLKARLECDAVASYRLLPHIPGVAAAERGRTT
jgi:hypothetical protein